MSVSSPEVKAMEQEQTLSDHKSGMAKIMLGNDMGLRVTHSISLPSKRCVAFHYGPSYVVSAAQGLYTKQAISTINTTHFHQ